MFIKLLFQPLGFNHLKAQFVNWLMQGNRRSAGFTNEERESFGANFLSNGFVDTFRKQHPNAVGYTYWGFRHGGRATNRGKSFTSLGKKFQMIKYNHSQQRL